MEKATFNLPILPPIQHSPLKINQHTVPIALELTSGDHVFTSTPVEIGSFFHFKVFAHIAIPYSYDSDMQYVTICGSDDTSEKQITIHTSLEQHDALTDSRKLNHSPETSMLNLWTNFIDNTPEIKSHYQTSIKQFIDNLVDELLNNNVQGVIQTRPAPMVTPGNYHNFKDMFAPKKADVEQPSLDDLVEVQTIVESTYYGTITWVLNYSFANIIGSTHDPKPTGYTSWIQLWALTCNNGYYPAYCSSYNYADGHPPFNCNTSDFVGGHVIPGQVAAPVATGGVAYIFPICKRHNGNDNIYMSMRYNPTGVVLHNYNQ